MPEFHFDWLFLPLDVTMSNGHEFDSRPEEHPVQHAVKRLKRWVALRLCGKVPF